MNVLLSIKPCYVDRIMSGEKKYEYRKTIFRRKNIDRIVVYSSGNVRRLVGEIVVKRIICDTPKNIWEKTSVYAGISEKDYYAYFKDRDKAYAIEILSFVAYDKEYGLPERYIGVKAPQSFRYVD